jgi:hypothetical protein
MGIARAALLVIAVFMANVSVKASAAEAAEPKPRTLFRCTLGGVTTFADRPCGDTTEERAQAQAVALRPDIIDRRDASPPARWDTSKALPSPAPSATSVQEVTDRLLAASRQRHAQTCRRIEAALRDIRSKMRAGYTMQQGERLRARQRTLNSQRRAEQCS